MTLIHRWNNFFFSPKDPRDLAISRILFCTGMLLHLALNHYWHWATVAHAFYRKIWLFRALGLSIVSEPITKTMQFAALALFALATLGLFTRISLALATPLILYLFALPSSFGKTGHGDAILVLITFVLAISRCDDAYSLEHYFKRPRISPSPGTPGEGRGEGSAPSLSTQDSALSTPSGEYQWPLQLACILLALVFFGAGITKLRRSGLDWITTHNFANLITQHLHLPHPPPTHWGIYISQHPALYKPLAAATILGEILFPLALFHKRATQIIIPLAFLTQILIGLTIGVWFTQFLLCYLFFIPWTKLLHPRRSPRHPHPVPSSN
jgi:hypothetical protein